MSATAKQYMLTQMNAYFAKVKAAITSGGASAFRYITGTVPANGTITIDAPTVLGFAAADYEVYSIGIEMRCVDPAISSNPPVIDSQAILAYKIAANGTIQILNNFNAVVTYHIRITMHVKK